MLEHVLNDRELDLLLEVLESDRRRLEVELTHTDARKLRLELNHRIHEIERLIQHFRQVREGALSL